MKIGNNGNWVSTLKCWGYDVENGEGQKVVMRRNKSFEMGDVG